MGWGPSSDKGDAPALLEKSFSVPVEALPHKLYGDAGYDADWIHAYCREKHGWTLSSNRRRAGRMAPWAAPTARR